MGKPVKIMGKGKYIVEVDHRQQFFLSFFHPAELCQTLAFGTVAVSAGIICWMAVSAVVALLHVTAKIRCPAVSNCPHYPVMDKGYVMGFAIGGAKLHKDVGKLRFWRFFYNIFCGLPCLCQNHFKSPLSF